MKLFKYIEFLKENFNTNYSLPSYEEAVELCTKLDSAFYETKTNVDGYPISVFNYRLAQYKDFSNPIPEKPELKGYEMRGLTFVFNKDGSLFNRYVLLEKFFNLNQVPETLYSVVKNYKIKFISNKEDGSIASFIELPNGKIVGRSKMGFDNDQANGINRVYKTNKDIKSFVDWCLSNDIIAIFEYVAPQNRIVLRYTGEELILLRLRDNLTGKHIDIRDHLDKVGSVRIAPFEDEIKDLDDLIELTATQVDKEGSIVTCEDEFGRDFFFKIKTPWYMSLHGLLTSDIYNEHVIISSILDDKIDDILGQIPEEEVETHKRINKIIEVVKKAISDKIHDLDLSYQVFVDMGEDRKEYALKYRGKEPNFAYVMAMAKGIDSYDLAKDWVSDNTKRLMMARDWLKKREPSLFFKDSEESDDN
jgi:T4 RnlA family RNA ligase